MKKIMWIILVSTSFCFGQNKQGINERQWVDSVYNSLNLDEKIGQLFMVAAYSNKNESHVQSLEKLIKESHIGGLIFFQGGPMRQAQITNRLQARSKLPMLIGIDAEWGLSMRLDSTYRFPWNMTLGAIEDLGLIEDFGKAVAQQSKRIGVQFNFAPVVDININPKNPIIGVRSFGEDKERVTERALAFTRGFQGEGLFATAKHFPGHGDTSADSHYNLPLLDFSKSRLHRIELYPYKALIDKGISSVMVAHLSVPSIEPDKNTPTSLSYHVVTKLLKEELGFEGLVFTDALNMKAAANYLKPGEVDLAAFQAGNDLLLFSEDVPTAAEKIRQAYEKGEVTEARLEYSVKKILKYKFRAGLYHTPIINYDNLQEELTDASYDDLNYTLYEQAMTVLKNEKHQIPFKNLEKQKFAYLKIGEDSGDSFLQMLRKFAPVEELTASQLDQASKYTKVIIGYHKTDNPWRKHEFQASEIDLIQKLAKQNKVVLVSFAKPYALSGIYNFDDIETVLFAYQNNKFAHAAAAQVLFGAIGAKGKLPVTVNEEFRVGEGIKTRPIQRLGFSTPSRVGMDAQALIKIDSIAQKAIEDRMTPGLQIVIARHGKVVYEKSFGYHTYDRKLAVQNTDLYDLASLTKILATVPMLIKMYDAGKITMQTPLGKLIPEFKYSDKSEITLGNLLTHQAGLQAWIPFYKKTLDDSGKPSEQWYSKTFSEDYPLQVSEHLFMKKNYNKEIVKQIAESSLLSKKEYKYSDLGFIALKGYIESVYRESLDRLVGKEFYSKLGAATLTYKPLQKFDVSEIAPTEVDTYFRYTTVHGYVHDMTAAMEGGVAGHAGLFANALDVTKMMQLFLNKGQYGEERFFSAHAFDVFNQCIYCDKGNRRGIGFDKPQLPGKPGPTCGCVAKSSFGHTGFTGTMAWADPELDLVFVFLSNRTYPDSSDNKLSKANVRENIQQVVYDAIIN